MRRDTEETKVKGRGEQTGKEGKKKQHTTQVSKNCKTVIGNRIMLFIRLMAMIK